MDKETAISKIRKLISLKEGAEKIGSEGEVYAAATLINKLLLQHNLSMVDINQEESKSSLDITESEYLCYNDRFGVWKSDLLLVIAKHNLCELITVPSRRMMRIVGAEENVVVVKEFYQYLVSTFLRLSQQRFSELQTSCLKEGRFLPPLEKRRFFKSYLLGVPLGLEKNYSSLERTFEENALMVTHKDVVDDYLEGKYGKMKSARARKQDADVGYQTMGYIDGVKVSLHNQLKDSPSLQLT